MSSREGYAARLGSFKKKPGNTYKKGFNIAVTDAVKAAKASETRECLMAYLQEKANAVNGYAGKEAGIADGYALAVRLLEEEREERKW